MKIYVLTYRSGEYADHRETFLGGYSSPEKREEALERCREARLLGRPRFPENDIDQFEKWEFVVDEDPARWI